MNPQAWVGSAVKRFGGGTMNPSSPRRQNARGELGRMNKLKKSTHFTEWINWLIEISNLEIIPAKHEALRELSDELLELGLSLPEFDDPLRVCWHHCYMPALVWQFAFDHLHLYRPIGCLG